MQKRHWPSFQADNHFRQQGSPGFHHRLILGGTGEGQPLMDASGMQPLNNPSQTQDSISLVTNVIKSTSNTFL